MSFSSVLFNDNVSFLKSLELELFAIHFLVFMSLIFWQITKQSVTTVFSARGAVIVVNEHDCYAIDRDKVLIWLGLYHFIRVGLI